MKRYVFGMVAIVIFVITTMFFTGQNCQAADSPDLTKIEKILPGVTTEAEVRILLGEPLSAKDILKAQGSGVAFAERRDMHYKVGDKEYIIRINIKSGRVVKVIVL